jgi:hypothetical protein
MTASTDERRSAVHNLIAAARRVYEERERLVADLMASTGLTRPGVILGFESLEHDATEPELRELVVMTPTTDRVHVVLAANVFVAPLRAIVLARAAAPRVTVRPSRRDPWLARAIVETAKDPAIVVTADLDVDELPSGEVHVYGRDETIAAVRQRVRPGVVVRAHGTGMGAAFVSRAADCDQSARNLAADIVPFDQRGCLSPRVAMVEGDGGRARRFAAALHTELTEFQSRIPRGALSRNEGHEAARWRDTVAFSAHIFEGRDHAVALAHDSVPPWIPPPGRHLFVVATQTIEQAAAWLAPVSAFVVTVGSDDPTRARGAFPAHVRVGLLGRMQHPPLDGPVDRRGVVGAGR